MCQEHAKCGIDTKKHDLIIKMGKKEIPFKLGVKSWIDQMVDAKDSIFGYHLQKGQR